MPARLTTATEDLSSLLVYTDSSSSCCKKLIWVVMFGSGTNVLNTPVPPYAKFIPYFRCPLSTFLHLYGIGVLIFKYLAVPRNDNHVTNQIRFRVYKRPRPNPLLNEQLLNTIYTIHIRIQSSKPILFWSSCLVARIISLKSTT